MTIWTGRMHCVTVFLKHYGTVLQCYCVTVTLRNCPTVTLVINVIIKLHNRVILRGILSPNMKVLSILVISVILSLRNRVIFWHIFSLNMRVSSILVISVIIKLQDRIVSRDTYQQSTVTQFWSVRTVTIRQSGDKIITLTRKLTDLFKRMARNYWTILNVT